MRKWLYILLLFPLLAGAATSNSFEFFLDFESDGWVTVSNLAATTKTIPPLTNQNWTVSDSEATNTFKYTTLNSQNVSNYWWSNSVTADSGTRALAISFQESASQNVELTFSPDGVLPLCFGVYIVNNLTNPSPSLGYWDAIYLYNSGGGNLCSLEYRANPGAYYVHGASNYNTFNGGLITGIERGKAYWITGRITSTEYTLAVYDPSNWTQVSTNSTSLKSTNAVNAMRIMNLMEAGAQLGVTNYLDNFIATTNDVFPLLPNNFVTNAADPLSQSAVQALVDAASNGDTIQLPAGSSTWMGAVAISNKAITLLGHTDGTWITNAQDGNIGSGTNLGRATVFNIYGTSNGLTRISEVNVHGLGGTNNNIGNGVYVAGDKWSAVRIDKCKFYFTGHGAVDFSDMVCGLVDHCEFRNCRSTVNSYALQRMNYSWTNGLTLGSTNAVVVEDNTVLYDQSTNMVYWDGSTNAAIGMTSQGLGGRSVWRFNKITNSTAIWSRFLDAHGNQQRVNTNIQPTISGTTNSHRGTRQVELYGNIVNMTTGDLRLTDLRGGTILMCSNTFLGTGADTNFYAREEDAPYENNFVSGYPGMDQHWLYLWRNTVNGIAVTELSFNNAQDADYLVNDTNVFWAAPTTGSGAVQTWTPLVYPHPLLGGNVASTLRFGTVRATTIRGR